MYWANFLHIYQPPTQSENIIRKIADESYVPLILGLEKYKKAKLTLNISGSLTELLAKYGYLRLLRKIGKLNKIGKIELTESAKYHPILPLLPESEIVRQINLNHETNRRYFGEDYKPVGFYPPEMAYCEKLGRILSKMGFAWVVADEISTGDLGKVQFDRIFYQQGVDLKLFLRSRRISNFVASGRAQTGRALSFGIRKRAKGQEFALTGVDGETFGHHNKNYDRVLFEAYRQGKLEAVTLSELATKIETKEEINNPKEASWSTSSSELRRGVGFALWDNPRNRIHKLQWKLTRLAIEKVEGNKNDPGYPTARHFLDLGLHSDQYWWASGKIIFGSFLLWSIEMIEAGARYLKRSVIDLSTISKKDKDKSHLIYDKILETAFSLQKQGVFDKKRRRINMKLKTKTVNK